MVLTQLNGLYIKICNLPEGLLHSIWQILTLSTNIYLLALFSFNSHNICMKLLLMRKLRKGRLNNLPMMTQLVAGTKGI